jgi:hypothetical protein
VVFRADGLLIVRTATIAVSLLLVAAGWGSTVGELAIFEVWLPAWAMTPVGVFVRLTGDVPPWAAAIIAIPAVGYAALWADFAFGKPDTSTYVLGFLWLPVWGNVAVLVAAGAVRLVTRLTRRAA